MESIIEALAKYFNPKFKKKLKRCESLAKLIKELEEKERTIERKLTTEHVDRVRETLKTKLTVLKVQIGKAENLLESSHAETP
ncbi:MAG: hypothetical protein V5789_02825 [Colwellia sp.]